MLTLGETLTEPLIKVDGSGGERRRMAGFINIRRNFLVLLLKYFVKHDQFSMKIPKAVAKYIEVVNNPVTYLKIEIERVKGNVQAKISDIVTKVIIFAAMGVVGLFVLTFGSITLGLYLNVVLESAFLGFLIVTGLYIMALIILLLISDKEKIVRNMLGFAKHNVAITLKEPQQFEQDPLPSKNGREPVRH